MDTVFKCRCSTSSLPRRLTLTSIPWVQNAKLSSVSSQSCLKRQLASRRGNLLSSAPEAATYLPGRAQHPALSGGSQRTVVPSRLALQVLWGPFPEQLTCTEGEGPKVPRLLQLLHLPPTDMPTGFPQGPWQGLGLQATHPTCSHPAEQCRPGQFCPASWAL